MTTYFGGLGMATDHDTRQSGYVFEIAVVNKWHLKPLSKNFPVI